MNKEELEKEIEETFRLVPNEPPESTVEILKERGCFQKDVLLYRAAMPFYPLEDRRRKMVQITCTACGNSEYVEYVPAQSGCRYGAYNTTFGFENPLTGDTIFSGTDCLCPECGKGVRALHISKFRKVYHIEDTFCITVHNINGHLVVLCWFINKDLDKSGTAHYRIHRWEGMMIVRGKPVRLRGYLKNINSLSFFPEWKKLKRFDERIGECSFNSIVPFDPEIIHHTDSANCAFAEYLNTGAYKSFVYPAAYLQIWTKHPQIENLIRQGCARLISDLISSSYQGTGYYVQRDNFKMSYLNNYIDWKQVKPAAMLRLTKEEFHLAKKWARDILWFYNEMKKSRNIRLSNETLKAAHEIGEYRLWEIFKDPDQHGFVVPLIKTINYLYKQRKTNPKRNDLITPRYLLDYWEALFKINQQMVPSLLYPKDLIKAHDDMNRRVKEKEDELLNQAIIARLPALEKLTFVDEELGLLIRPCRSHKELIDEGKKLNHCVGRYAESYARGKTSIFFIRKIAEPNTPYYTLEWQYSEVAQNRGKSNCARTPEVKEFETKWLKYIKNTEKKEKKANAKRSNTRAAQLAIA